MRRMTKKMMESFGFKELIENTQQYNPIWKNCKLNIYFYEIPTPEEFLSIIINKSINDGRQELRKEIKRVLEI